MKNLILLLSATVLILSCNQNDTAEAKTATDTKPNIRKVQNSTIQKPTIKNQPLKANPVNNAVVAEGEGIQWVKLNDVEAKMKKEKKPIIMDVYTVWCGPCKMLDRNTFTNPEIISIFNDKFHPVKFNAEGPDEVNFGGKVYSNPGYKPERAKTRNGKHQYAATLAVRGYPSLVVMDENYKIIEKIAGYRTPDQLKTALAKYL